MSDTARHAAAELRREFDEAFARPVVVDQEVREQLLLVRAGDRQLALRTAEVAGILRSPQLTAVPGGHAALCGLAGVRGALVAVYSLASLLGSSRRPQQPGWLVPCRADRSAALSFDELVGHVRVPRADILVAARAGELVRIAGVDRLVPNVPALLEIIRGAGRSEE